MKLKFQLMLAAVAVTVCSCNIQREGCYTGKAPSHVNPEFKVAASASPTQTEQYAEVTLLPQEEAQAISVTDNAACNIAETESELPVLIAMAPELNTESESTSAITITSVMAKELRAAATTIDNRFARRIITRSANRMEKMNFDTPHRETVFDKVRNKMSEKFFTYYAAREGTMNILSIVSLVSGILSFAYYAAFPFGVAAIVLGAVALAKGTDRRGMAITGIILGAIAIAFWSGWFATV